MTDRKDPLAFARHRPGCDCYWCRRAAKVEINLQGEPAVRFGDVHLVCYHCRGRTALSPEQVARLEASLRVLAHCDHCRRENSLALSTPLSDRPGPTETPRP